jgi:hypothetical protein
MRKITAIFTALIIIYLLFAVSCVTTTSPPIPEFISREPPPVITDEYISVNFYSRPPEIEFSQKAYGLDGDRFYVSAIHGNDGNPGSEKLPLASIQKAIECCGPGDIIYVMQGTYYSDQYTNVACFMNKHGNPDHWIMLRNYPGHHPLIRYKGWDAISVQGSSYIIVSGFVIRGRAGEIDYKYGYENRKNKSNPVIMGGGVGIIWVCNYSGYFALNAQNIR